MREVDDESPAAAAGLAEGDLIVAAGGRDVRRADDLFEALGALGSGAALELTVVRGSEERSISVTPVEEEA